MRCFAPVLSERLGARVEARADQRSVGAQHQRRGQAAAVGNAAGRNHRGGRHRIHHRRHQRQRGASAAVPPCLGALGDDEVGPRLACHPCLFHILNLANQLAAGRFDRRCIRPRIAEGEQECIRAVAEGQVQRAPVDGPGDQPDAPGPAGLFLHAGQLRAQPGGVAIASADQSQPAGVGNGCRQMPARYAAHRSEYDRMLQSEQFSQCRHDHRSSPVSDCRLSRIGWKVARQGPAVPARSRSNSRMFNPIKHVSYCDIDSTLRGSERKCQVMRCRKPILKGSLISATSCAAFSASAKR